MYETHYPVCIMIDFFFPITSSSGYRSNKTSIKKPKLCSSISHRNNFWVRLSVDVALCKELVDESGYDTWSYVILLKFHTPQLMTNESSTFAKPYLAAFNRKLHTTTSQSYKWQFGFKFANWKSTSTWNRRMT